MLLGGAALGLLGRRVSKAHAFFLATIFRLVSVFNLPVPDVQIFTNIQSLCKILFGI